MYSIVCIGDVGVRELVLENCVELSWVVFWVIIGNYD